MTLPMLRQGICQPEVCGSACCTFVLLEVNPIYLTDADLAQWVRLHGIELTEHNGRTLARIDVRCLVLGESGKCLLYGQPDRPNLCEQFPQTPAALSGIDSCTYRFDEGGL